MTVIIGTQVIDKVVPTDTGDTYGTHDDQYGIGGFRPVETIVLMEAISNDRRKEGMEVRVYGEVDPLLNGRYVLQDDLTTWVLQVELLKSPPDAGWGEGASDTHALTGVTVGDTAEDHVDKILTYLDTIQPIGPATIDAFTLDIPNLFSANEQGQGGHVPANNIQILIQPTGTLSGKFGDAKAGIVTAEINTVDEGNKTLTADPAGSDNGTVGALTLANEVDYNFLFQQIDGSITSSSPLALNNFQHNYKLKHGILFSDINFYVDDPTQPSVISMALVGAHIAPVLRISGVPSLDVGDSLETTFTIVDAVSWFYNLVTFGRVESDYTNNADTGLVVGKNNGDNVVWPSFVTSVIDTIYTESADVDAYGYNARRGTPEEIGTDTGTSNTSGTSGTIRIDTVSDEAIRLTSGENQYPAIGGGQAGQVFNSVTLLTVAGNEELMLQNGKFLYPAGDFTLNNPTAGPDYSSVPAGAFNGQRWATFQLSSITGQVSVEFDIDGLVGFNGNPLESGDYSLYVTVDGDTGWLDANAPYPGSGNPVNNGDPALDVASSSQTHKRVTFGITPRTGDVYVRIGWASTQTREITLIS